MTDNQITYAQVRALAEEIVAENPNLVNPRGTDGCLYKRRDDDHSELTAERCLGGEILYRLGLRLPEEYETIHASPDADRLSNTAISFLRLLQSKADNPVAVFATGQPQPSWGEALIAADRDFVAYRLMHDMSID